MQVYTTRIINTCKDNHGGSYCQSVAIFNNFKRKIIMEKYFKVGQKVWDFRFGEGVVTGDESLNVYYPIIVRFGFGDAEQSYTADGKHIIGCLYISLFQTAPIITPNVPIVEFEQGELVWVKRDNDNEWCARYFSHQEEEYFFCFCAQKKGGSRHPWKNISKLNDIPF